jgi:hypothetical protein
MEGTSSQDDESNRKIMRTAVQMNNNSRERDLDIGVIHLQIENA